MFDHALLDKVESSIKLYGDTRTEEIPEQIGNYVYKSEYKFATNEGSEGYYCLYRAPVDTK